jgi:hypothetical protein
MSEVAGKANGSHWMLELEIAWFELRGSVCEWEVPFERIFVLYLYFCNSNDIGEEFQVIFTALIMTVLLHQTRHSQNRPRLCEWWDVDGHRHFATIRRSQPIWETAGIIRSWKVLSISEKTLRYVWRCRSKLELMN